MFSFLIFAIASISDMAMSHTSSPGQIAQHQARRLLTIRQPFAQSGSVSIDGKTYTTELKWYGPASYDFSVLGLPNSFSGMAGNEGRWTLERRAGNRCAIQTGNRRAQCGSPTFWAMIELSAQPDAVGAALVRAGIYGTQDLSNSETHTATVLPPEKRRAKPAIGKNGETPKAVVRVQAPNSEADTENIAYIDFDQNFLVPLYAQFANQGVLHKIKAYTELGIDRDQPRNSHVLATSLTISTATETLARFNRKEPVVDRNLKETKFQDGVIALSSLQESLGSDASALLTSILLTH